MKKELVINDKKIGFDTEPYVIAELSGNHNGDINRAINLIDAAVASGANAIKLQTYTADTLTIDSNRSEFIVKGGPWSGQNFMIYIRRQVPHGIGTPQFFNMPKKKIFTVFLHLLMIVLLIFWTVCQLLLIKLHLLKLLTYHS